MREQEHTNTQSPVDISVVMATLNRDEQLRRTLDAYRSLDTTGIRWELIVVDNNSTDNTAGVLDAFVIPGSVFAISCAAARARSYSLNDAQVPRNPHASRKASNN